MKILVSLSLSVVLGCALIGHPKARAEDKKTYQANLRAKFSGRITYRTDEARRIISSFNIDCQMKDGRYLPLLNVLSTRLQEFDRKDMWLETEADSRDGNVRIYDYMRGPSGAITKPMMSYEISKWGELRPIGTTVEALLNACRGSYGPIWMLPQQIIRNQ